MFTPCMLFVFFVGSNFVYLLPFYLNLKTVIVTETWRINSRNSFYCIVNNANENLKTLVTFGNWQRPVFSFGVSQQTCGNLNSSGRRSCEIKWKKNTLVTRSCVLSDAFKFGALEIKIKYFSRLLPFSGKLRYFRGSRFSLLSLTISITKWVLLFGNEQWRAIDSIRHC